MTSGTFEHVSPDFIFVNREARQRRELNDIESLAKSIADNGLIHPPVIRRSGELIVGERRWTAIKTLGWTSMPIQWVDELSEIELHAIEYEENIGRMELPWQDRVAAVESYHLLRLAQDSEWKAEQTAERLGVKLSSVHQHLAIAKAVKTDERIASAPKLSTARSMTARKNSREAGAAMDRIEATVTGEAPAKKQAPIVNDDFTEFTAAYTGTPYNLIHCDFPYGVDMHETDQGGARHEFGGYADSVDVYWRLLDTLAEAMTNVVAPKAHLIFWFSMKYYTETKAALEAMGWKVNPHPLVWVKSDNLGVIPDAKRGPRQIYETAFLGSRGDLFIHTPVSNAFSHPGKGKSIHMNEKPVPMLKHFMRMVCDEYSRVLDPTCGSANALKAASLLGAPTVLGIERDATFFARAAEAYFQDETEIEGIEL